MQEEYSFQKRQDTYRSNKTLITQISADPNLTQEEKDYFVAFYERCRKRVTGLKKEILIKEGKFQELRDLLENNLSNDEILTKYSSYIIENKLDEAENYLQNLNGRIDEKLSDFIAIQGVNLEQIRSGGDYIASESELTTVEVIARKRHPYSGYAKALYYTLTGEIISSELPGLFVESEARIEIQTSKLKPLIFPNPFNDQLHVKIGSLEGGRLQITDIIGNFIHIEDISQSSKINTSGWSDGLYIITLYSNDKIILKEK